MSHGTGGHAGSGSGSGRPVRVVIADDQSLIVTGLRLILDSEPGIEVVGEAGNGLQAVTVVDREHPDVILMDIRMPEVDGIEGTRRIVESGSATRVLVLTTFDEDEMVFSAMRAGASGFLLKDIDPPDLIHAIRVAGRGDSVLAPELVRRLVERFTAPSAESLAAISSLTEREREIFWHLARGRTNDEIGTHLFISPATVKTHVSRVLAKLGLRDRTQAVVLGYESGVVVPGRKD
ncbi:response regulator [Micromonospora sp. NBC_00617]|uniref:response regulator n=1 Tax=Micromonospora sp. NBC_00617 TaxID=2903587 RepID=UPI0030E293D8